MKEETKDEPCLLPCPFCGGEPVLLTAQRRYEFCAAVECQDCGANTGPASSSLMFESQEKQVIEKWNSRAKIKP